MTERKYGTVSYRQNLSDILEIFRITPEGGERFPAYTSGQYIELIRESCKLTRKIVDADGGTRYAPDVDDDGERRRGEVKHSYSIASAPFETERNGYLEFYVGLEMVELGEPGRLSESLFHPDAETGDRLSYADAAGGDFTLQRRAAEFANVVLVGSGTGLAPFISMIKQLHHEALGDRVPPARYTLIHTNRTIGELGYHRELMAVARSQKFDFVYVPTISRPAGDVGDSTGVGRGRANNVLRSVFDLMPREEEDYRRALNEGSDGVKERIAFDTMTKPSLPRGLSQAELLDRMDPPRTVILACGNPSFLEDVQGVAARISIRCETEGW